MSLTTAAHSTHLPVSGVMYRFPRRRVRLVELQVFGAMPLLLFRHDKWFGSGYVEVVRLLADKKERYRLYDDGRMLEAAGSDWRAVPKPGLESLLWMTDLRFRYTSGKTSVWSITWMEHCPKFIAGRLRQGLEEAVVIAPQFVVKVAPRLNLRSKLRDIIAQVA